MKSSVILQCDLWGNITYYKNHLTWVKQNYLGNVRTSYEDSDGNYWDRSWGLDFTFYNYIHNYHHDPAGDTLYITDKKSEHNNDIYITSTSIWMPIRDMVISALRAPLIPSVRISTNNLNNLL